MVDYGDCVLLGALLYNLCEGCKGVHQNGICVGEGYISVAFIDIKIIVIRRIVFFGVSGSPVRLSKVIFYNLGCRAAVCLFNRLRV